MQSGGLQHQRWRGAKLLPQAMTVTSRWPTWPGLGPYGFGSGAGDAHVFGGLAENVAHATTIAQPVVHDGDDAHQQRVAGPLCALQLFTPYRQSACSYPTQATCPCAPPPGAQDTLASPSRTSGTETPESQSSLSLLHVPTNVAAPCGIPRGLARGDMDEVTRRSKWPALSFPWL